MSIDSEQRTAGEAPAMNDADYQVEVVIRSADGLHMRPAMQFVDLAGSFQSDIRVSNQQTDVDAKSIMQMTMLAATDGTKLRISAKGADAQKAVEALQKLVEEGLFKKAPAELDSSKEG